MNSNQEGIAAPQPPAGFVSEKWQRLGAGRRALAVQGDCPGAAEHSVFCCLCGKNTAEFVWTIKKNKNRKLDPGFV